MIGHPLDTFGPAPQPAAIPFPSKRQTSTLLRLGLPMDALDELIRPIRHSPQLPLLVDRLTRHLQAERHARERFYDEMTPEQKIEFLDGGSRPGRQVRRLRGQWGRRVLDRQHRRDVWGAIRSPTGSVPVANEIVVGTFVSGVIRGLEIDVEAIFDDEKNLTALAKILARGEAA